MTIGELKKELEKFPDDIEVYASPVMWIPSVGDVPSPPTKAANVLEKHKIEMFRVLESRPAPGFEGPTTIAAYLGFNENIEKISENDFTEESDTIN